MFCSYIVITVAPAMSAVTVQESDQMVEIQINVTTFFSTGAATVPFTLTYTTMDITARGMLY